MNRGRLVAVVAGAAVLAAAVVMLRQDVQPPVSHAHRDAAVVNPPQRPGERPRPPGRLHFDARRGGAVVSWPPAPYGFEVRWGRAGGQPRNLRYVATPAAGLRGLAPGKYHVEVRSVDEIGQRSEPSSADVEVSDREPSWLQGLGFIEDFASGAGLRADRWIMSDHAPGCVHREGGSGPILLDLGCDEPLQPASPLVLSEPDAAGVRGRVVILADTPPPAPPPPDRSRAPEPEPPPGDFGMTNQLHITLSSSDSMTADPFAGMVLRIGSDGAALLVDGDPDHPPLEHQLDAAGTGSPGTLRRWELVFTADQVQVHLDGEQIGSMEYRPPWRQAYLAIYNMVVAATSPRAVARVGLVGLTGPAPDGRVTERIRLAQIMEPAAEQRVPIAVAPTAQSASLSGIVLGTGPGAGTGPGGPGGGPPRPPEVLAAAGEQQLPLRRHPVQPPPDPNYHAYTFTVDIPARALAPGTTVTLRSVDGAEFQTVNVLLELVHRPGTQLPVHQPQVDQPHRLTSAAPRLVVRHGQEVTSSGQPVPPGKLEVEVHSDALSYQGAAGELAGFVALHVELDGKRILEFPTASDGPAVAGLYRFTLDVSGLPAGSYQKLVARLIADRPDAAAPNDEFTLRLAG